MPTMFDEREAAFETKFARDEELKFRARARRDKLFALWAAGRLGLTGTAHDGFVRDLLAVQGFPRHDTAMLARATADGLDPGETAEALVRLGGEALEQLRHGTATPIDLTAP